jgi:pimeloyl-ACP methyl ester carboxylesterase
VAEPITSLADPDSALHSSQRQPVERPRLAVSEQGHGRAVLFIHGQPGSARDFDQVAPLLADDHRLLMPDRPGYGASGGPPLSMVENADALAGVLDDLETGGTTLVGHSYGGGIAILLAARRPELVSGLVLAGSVGGKDSVDAFDHVLAAPVVGDAVSAVSLFALANVFPRIGDAAVLAPAGVRERLRVMLPHSDYLSWNLSDGREVLRTFLFEQRTLVREIGEVERALGQIDTPTVVIAGEWDVVVRPSAAASIASSIRGAELVTVARVGHFVLRDAPEVVADAVRAVEQRAEISRHKGGE